MPWFRHPVTQNILQPDPAGPLRMSLRAIIPVELELSPNVWFPIRRAIVDTGSSLCVFSAVWARANGFALPPVTSALPTTTAAGPLAARVHDVDLNARFLRMPEHTFSLAVVFSEAHPPNVLPLLGLHNLLNYWQYTFDGSPEPAASMGHMRFETL